MKRFLLTLCALAVLAGSAQAGIITHPDQFWFPTGEQTVMKLVNYESEINGPNGTEGVIEEGDRLRGIFRITESNLPGDPDATRKIIAPGSFELTGVFDILVNRVDPIGGGSALFEFVPEPTFEATYGTGAMVAFYHDTTPNFSGLGATTAISEATATDGSLYLVLGANDDWGDVNADGDGYYWAGNGSLTPSVASFSASLALLTNNTGLLDEWFKTLTQDPPLSGSGSFTNEAGLDDILNEFALQGNTVANTDPGSPWDIKSQDPLRSAVVPEPSAIVLFGGLLGLLAMVGVYRRKRS